MSRFLIPAFLVSAFSSAILTVLVRNISLKNNFRSIPSEDRYNPHSIALGGGIAIIISILISFAIFFPLANAFNPELLIISLLAVFLFAAGLADDIKSLTPMQKLIFQIIAAGLAAFFAGGRVELFIESRLITAVMSIFWIVLLINSFNFLDNMDGASAGIAIIVSAVLGSASYISGDLENAIFAAVLCGTLSGFLIFNFPPAKIFMGDAGSLVIGFLIALLTLRITYYNETSAIDSRAAVFVPLIAVAVPLYDFISVTLLRISQGRSPFLGDTQHFSHRLKRRGLSDSQAALTLYLATICTGLGAVFLSRATLIQAGVIFTQTLMILGIIAILEKNNKIENTGINGSEKKEKDK
ncbi:putative undecaprenyl-phosphate N-acetylglucosaminyl 1-phosphate transferase [Sedimentisphaera cyanobacteriorum]|uniref:Putative undecaprenyl-phosphate N-acetylglucosaminyl 1-phosphate transferase n=1 Tax=Sedimentisphaera cyanobacteriorum TaxID=1940790 RepID=A0A1Q2HRT8_9BACT|nr:MraY family glycosyltransferase [Sedimentisphaera cyanobacteriorum]AQQ10142.1 putative undecaprenyl-phosphate N-acetylglucosaminyl 1-phosphate transferase [Sedimentisphaera cyanobacteriorum]